MRRIGEYGARNTRRRARRAARFMVTCALVTCAAMGLLVSYLVLRAEIVRACDRLSHANARLQSLRNEWDRRSLELSRLTSLDRIDTIARTKLGMVNPREVGVVVVDARPLIAAVESQGPESHALGEPPTVLAGAVSFLEQMAVAAASNLVAAWFARAPVPLPSVLQ
jgi:cell division protein FtsB